MFFEFFILFFNFSCVGMFRLARRVSTWSTLNSQPPGGQATCTKYRIGTVLYTGLYGIKKKKNRVNNYYYCHKRRNKSYKERPGLGDKRVQKIYSRRSDKIKLQ